MAVRARSSRRYFSSVVILEMLLAGVLMGLAAFGLKFGVLDISLSSRFLLEVLSNPLIWAVGVISIIGFVLMQKSLHGEKVAIVTPMIGGISIILPVLLALGFLGETVSALKWAGIILILIGVTGLGK